MTIVRGASATGVPGYGASDIQLRSAAALGQLEPQFRVLRLGGRNPACAGGGAVEDLWQGGGTYTFLSAAAALEVLSSSANDTAAGTGARTVKIDGLDTIGVEITSTVTLNGVTPVALSGTFLRVNFATVLTCGSGGTNAGTLTVRTVVGATAQAVIAIGDSVARQFIYTVPAGYSLITGTFFLTLHPAAISVGDVAAVNIVSRAQNSGTWIKSASFGLCDFTNTVELRPDPMRGLPAMTDLRFTVSGCSASLDVSGNMAATLVDNTVDLTKFPF